MRLVPDVPPLSAAEKDALIAMLVARVDELAVRVATLEAQRAALQVENAILRDQLKLPLKTPRLLLGSGVVRSGPGSRAEGIWCASKSGSS